MNLEWQQWRLLQDLDDIYEYGGRLTGRPVYDFEGWKDTQSGGGRDISYKVSEDMVRPLLERGYIRVDAAQEFEITDKGANVLRES
jgi:hypothetical protein